MGEVRSPDSSHVNLALVLIQDRARTQSVKHFHTKMRETLGSIFTFSSGVPMHFIVITDKSNIQEFGHFFSDLITKKVSEDVIESVHWKWRRFNGFPKLKISFVDIEDILGINRAFIKALKNNGVGKSGTKYSADLFYISPLFHLAFTSLNKMILLDSSDLVFFSDIRLLADQFDLMVDEVVGVGLDLSPHYRHMLVESGYITSHPDTVLGLPGKFQGLNMGVVLFSLEKMRNCKLYNSYINTKMVSVLTKSYQYLAHQDWFTNLQWSQPSLFYTLPCQFNTQTSVQYFRPPWEEKFFSYHHCDNRSNILILHRNGCGPSPVACGYTLQPGNKHWKSQTLDLDVPLFFQAMALVNRGWTGTG